MGKRKGQTSVEFIVILIVVAGLLLIASSSLKVVDLSSLSNQDELSAREIGDYVAAKINEVYIAGNGAEFNVVLPDKLRNGKDYGVNLMLILIFQVFQKDSLHLRLF